MNKRALVLATAACFAIIACQSSEPIVVAQAAPPAKSGDPVPDKKCPKSDKCELTVTVNSCNPGGISISHYTLGVEVGSGEVDINWSLDDESAKKYEFHKSEGIKFKKGGWEQEFGKAQGNKNKFTWHDRNHLGKPLKRRYDYTIYIVNKKDGSACGSLDPTIINDS